MEYGHWSFCPYVPRGHVHHWTVSVAGWKSSRFSLSMEVYVTWAGVLIK